MLNWMVQERASGARPGQTRVMGVIVVRTRSSAGGTRLGRVVDFTAVVRAWRQRDWP